MKNNLKDYLVEEGDSFNKGCANAYSHITTLRYSHEGNISGFCEYTNFWLYGKLKLTDKITYNKILHDFFENLDNFYDCKEYAEAIDENTYSDLKKLDELYEKFYIFKEESSTDDHNRCIKGEICAQEYKKLENTCVRNGNNSFCNELEKFRVLFNNHLESMIKCNNMEELQSFQGTSLASTISLPLYVMSVGKFFVQN
ncbi:hypothetical protein PCYB_006850 [Plasmodium cynomolgi strain B]|uniref:PIR Superfamily Protein n=1 Tax=Plasmodium cynomolgi (strain B) TaxID=1120755 RepID=K6UFE0_PLACD|nr:hypothetical protein PCYB_006850 [Plasmodium cynomolgi strain B]GAB69936.1 hypothetical protein PCYB_006850 [Plasmodium cynomolgi strain B]